MSKVHVPILTGGLGLEDSRFPFYWNPILPRKACRVFEAQIPILLNSHFGENVLYKTNSGLVKVDFGFSEIQLTWSVFLVR